MANFVKPFIFVFFCLVLQAPNAFGEESTEDQVNHVTHGLFREAKAIIEQIAANAKSQESKLVSDANRKVADFRKYIFEDYDLKDKKVDECVNKALSAIETKEFTPTDCRQPKLYISVHDEILEKYSEENILNKANELCEGDVKQKESKKAVECIEKAFKEIEKENSEKDIKKRFSDLVKGTRDCLQKQIETYKDANEKVKKCPKK